MAAVKVFFLPQDIDGSGCYRCVFPMLYLRERGWDADMPEFRLRDAAGNLAQPLPGRAGLRAVPAGNYTIEFIQTSVVPDLVVVQGGLSDRARDEALRLRRAGAALVVDLDDDVHRVPAYNPGRVTEAGFSRRNTQLLVQAADLVTVATAALAEFYGRWNRNVVVLRNRLHWPMWETIDRGAGWSRFRVGYMGNVNFHRADLEVIAPQLRKWLERNPDVEFVAAGDPRIHDIVGTPEGQRVCTSAVFFRNQDLPQITATFDVGLVPLVRNAFNECKSWLKGMEYNACGIPFIASPTAEYRRLVSEGAGWLAKHPKDWVERLDAVYEYRAEVPLEHDIVRRQARELALDRHIGEWEAAYGRTEGGNPDAVAPREERVAA